jgi:hypothetical protein
VSTALSYFFIPLVVPWCHWPTPYGRSGAPTQPATSTLRLSCECRATQASSTQCRLPPTPTLDSREFISNFEFVWPTVFFSAVRFEASVWPNGHYIHTLGGLVESPSEYRYWLLYLLPERPDPSRPPSREKMTPRGELGAFFAYKKLLLLES